MTTTLKAMPPCAPTARPNHIRYSSILQHTVRPFAATRVVLFVLTCLFTIQLQAQRCATVPYTQKLKSERQVLESEEQFENWLKNKLQNRSRALNNGRTQTSYQVPVVVHIIHKGEAVGVGSNISDAQILSQIEVLNNDFQRFNADASNTPAEFQGVAGSMDIEFVMAKQTPEGGTTNGIVRVQGSKNLWLVSDNYELKAQSYWPAEDYLNIWVTDLGNGYLGYAQFPVSGLPGLGNSSTNRLTDGIVIDYTAFGTIDAGAFDLDPSYNKGRTTTHEMGHFFGLRHIWGDDEDETDRCVTDDYVDDTPLQELSTTNCPSGVRTSCSVSNMYQNYMDYTHDNCMNLFTAGQVDRMTTILENAPRRASLLTSPGLSDPAPVANDLGIRSIVTPQAIACVNPLTPVIEVRNYGTNSIASAQIRVRRNSVIIETLTFPLDLDPDEATTVTFNPQSLSPGLYTFSFEILQTNGLADGNDHNNNAAIEARIPNTVTTPFVQAFNTTPTTWTINNPDGGFTWQNETAPNGNPTNKAMHMNFYDYEDNEGEIDILLTPVFDLSLSTTAYVSFDVAYALFPGNTDGLRVYVLTNCESDVLQGTKVYDKFGSALATASNNFNKFVPSNASQWRKESVGLNDFVGMESVQLAFVGVNGWGNSLYLDNVTVGTDAKEDLTLAGIIKPSPVTCSNTVMPELTISNTGVPVTSFKVSISVNNGAPQVHTFSQPIATGGQITLALPEVSLQKGSNILTFTITEPNGFDDINPADNARSIITVVDSLEDRLPLRQNFDDEEQQNWILTNPNGGLPWESVETNFNESVYFNAYNNSVIGDEAWLVSPVLDLANRSEISLRFDISYAFNDPRKEILRILTSIDCGQTYNNVIYDEAGDAFAILPSSSAWSPSVEADWTQIEQSLDILAGEENARIAFVVTNANGNNLYLDNIEFFVTEVPEPVVTSLFLIYGTSPQDPGDFTLAFNLPERNSVGYEIIDTMGKVVAQAEIADVLNQTFVVDAGHVVNGIYFVRLRIGTQFYSSKIYIGR